jgi:outer membrane protein assembly factor BamB
VQRSQLLVNGWKHMGGYDLLTGKELWKMRGGGDIPVPTPIVAHDLVFMTSAHGKVAPIIAVHATASGDVDFEEEDPPIVWRHMRRGNYMQTPLCYGDELYLCNDLGMLTCYQAQTGKEIYRQRLGGGGMGFTASPVAAAGKLYFTNETGEVHVIKAGLEFEELAVNQMNETCMATPAISRGTLFVRTRGHLVAIGERE